MDLMQLVIHRNRKHVDLASLCVVLLIFVACKSEDRNQELWNGITGIHEIELEWSNFIPTLIRWSPNGERVAILLVKEQLGASDFDFVLRVFNADLTEIILEHQFHGGAEGFHFSWASDNNRIRLVNQVGEFYRISEININSTNALTIWEGGYCYPTFVGDKMLVIPCNQRGQPLELTLFNDIEQESELILPSYMARVRTLEADTIASQILLIAEANEINDLFHIELSSGEITQITSDIDLESSIAWAPHNNIIAYIRSAGSESQLVIQDLTNSCSQELITMPYATDVDWHPTQDLLYVIVIDGEGHHLLSLDLQIILDRCLLTK